MNTPDKKRFKNSGGIGGRYAPLKGMLKTPPKELRLQLGLTQSDFWSPVGISQSGGSRYEAGRKLPAATSALLHLVHIEGLDINQLSGDDFRVGRHLRETNPADFAAILAKVGGDS
jgi:DNA-binding XRE family transcriptional regulator